MRKRIKSLTVAVAALAALALGGSALATASNSPSTSAPEKVSATDTGPAVQQGDQTTPDAAAAKHANKAAEPRSASDPAGPNDTTSPDAGNAGSETASETGPSDGPGGFADTGTTADTQQQGEH